MELGLPRFAGRSEVFLHRPDRLGGTRFTGLWVAGSLTGLGGPTAAVVGARAPSEAGKARAQRLGEALARAGVCVVSGLALGIDGAAHAGAVAAGGVSIGILGGGHRHFFPRKHRGLATAMLAGGGAVVSPFGPDEPARPPQFLQRNAVVAALADVVVLVEAAARSGALNTAGWAASQGVDVLAYPGDVDRPQAAGCNALIRDGATLVRDPDDVLAALGLAAAAAFPERAPQRDGREPLAAALLGALRRGPSDFESLLAATRAATAQVSATLVRLEIEGEVERFSDTLHYALRKR